MGNQSVTQWAFENVLFLDADQLFNNGKATQEPPNAKEKLLVEPEPKSDVQKKTLRRNVPDQRTLQPKFFPISLTLNNKTAEFYIQCVNHPDVALVLCDRLKKVLRSIPINNIHEITRHKLSIKCTFKNLAVASSNAQLVLQFPSNEVIQSFVDTVKLMFGIYVSTYGITRQNEIEDNSHNLPKYDSTEERCLIHGLNSCKCNLKTQGYNQQLQEEAYISTKYPISMVGNLESGSVLSWNDVTTLERDPSGVVVVWRVAIQPGKNPIFNDDSSKDTNYVIYNENLKLTNMMVGKMVQVKVTRGFHSEKSEVICSVAQRGPITINSNEAREILELFCRMKNVSFEISVSHLKLLWPDQFEEDLLYLAPFYKGFLTLMNEGLHINLEVSGEEFSKNLTWSEFYPTRDYATDENYEKELILYLHFIDDDNMKQEIELALPSYNQRNALFHAIYFYKLQPHQQNYDRWIRDLESNNFAVFKSRYSKLWQRTNYVSDIINIY